MRGARRTLGVAPVTKAAATLSSPAAGATSPASATGPSCCSASRSAQRHSTATFWPSSDTHTHAPARRANGTLLSGQAALNPGGRPRSTIEEVRAQLLPRLPEYLEAIDKLTRSRHEATRLAAVKEILDRLLGKPAVFVDSTHTRVDIASLYLQALKQVNGAVVEAPASSTEPSHILPSDGAETPKG
jgi:hypothetical protein